MSSADAVEIPLIKATNETLKGYGYLIDSYENSDIEMTYNWDVTVNLQGR